MAAPLSERHQTTGKQTTNCAVTIPDLLLPNQSLDMHRWPVIACDQHTSEPEYWAETARIVDGDPSSLHIILPEVYLERLSESELNRRYQAIHLTMRRYLDESILEKQGPGCILVERETPQHKQRLGLVLTIDLEHYDYRPGSRSMIRATEETVEARIPPRMAIRENASMELSHIQLLIDDPGRTIIEPLYALAADSSQKPCYETELLQNGGFVKGWFFKKDNNHLEQALDALNQLDSIRRYGLMMAVGDGNHSLATAKAHWDRHKAHLPVDHPARFAMVEVINLYDPGLTFEPIHRVVTAVNPADFKNALLDWFASSHAIFRPQTDPAAAAGKRLLTTLLTPDGVHDLLIDPDSHDIPAALIQSFLDNLMRHQPTRLDYIHGTDVLHQLAARGAIGLILPSMQKDELFPYIATNNLLPRKTFSLGAANEKRYYMECRLI